ncbi:MAG: L,D-transpeptidase family protein [Fibrobacteria bacterium]
MAAPVPMPGWTVMERLDAAMTTLEKTGRPDPTGDSLFSDSGILRFYRGRGCKPAWVVQGTITAACRQLFEAVKRSRLDGLDPDDYHSREIDSFLALIPIPGRNPIGPFRFGSTASVSLDLLLTDAYLTLGDHLLSGRIRPRGLNDLWHIAREDLDLPGRLESALGSGIDIGESLAGLAPRDPGYALMKKWLAEFRKMMMFGGWPEIPDGPTIAPGGRDERVEALCRRLHAEGDLPNGACPDSLSPEMAAGLRRFQERHGLEPTGTATNAVFTEFAPTVGDRIVQIKINLECWRWLPLDLGRRHVRVNIADYRLQAFEDGRKALGMKVIIGRKEDRTPVFSDRITALTLHPPWNVPAVIAREEILPEWRKDAGYLARNEMEIVSASGGPISFDPGNLQGIQARWEVLGYRIRQRPGAANALGLIKFELTNPFNIYLHDTPSPAAFLRDYRALIHGCVRVEKPMELAIWALGPDSAAYARRLQNALAGGRTATLALPGSGIPVYLLYWTAFTDDRGGLAFRRDIYGWDVKLAEALREPPIL